MRTVSPPAGSRVTRPNSVRRAPTGTAIRPDIQALRALAVALVVIYHLWPTRLPGGYVGVDVFFVISGFLITSHLLAHPPSNPRNLLEFWSRRVRRLLPAALLVLAVTLVATRVVAPATIWAGTARDIRAAAAYFVNWRFAARSVNYLAQGSAPSAVEHFWSLSVEEQFYLIWPVLILIVVGIARLRRWRMVPVTIVGLSVVVAASLAYSIYETNSSPAQAYFVTPTRIWELGVGGLLAAALSGRALGRNRDSESVPLPTWARVALTWAGLVAMVVAACTFTADTPFPGYRALLPVLGAVAVIAAMPPRAPGSPAAVMAWRPVQWLGDVSYSVYLWHWPMIALLPYVSGGHLGWLDKSAIVVATLILAGLTKPLIEDRFRNPRWGRPLLKPYALGAVMMAVVVVAASVQLGLADSHSRPVAHAPTGTCIGAAALDPARHCPSPRTDHGPLVESPAQAAQDIPAVYPDGCFANNPNYPLIVCHYGDQRGKIRVALVGNSHAGQWLPPLNKLAEEHHWALDTFVASRCANAIGIQQVFTKVGNHAAECERWAESSTRAVIDGHYGLVVMSNRVSGRAAGHKDVAASQRAYEAGYLRVLEKFRGAGLTVLGIRDSPAPATVLPTCLADHPHEFATCDFSRATRLPGDPLVAAIHKLNDPRITLANLNRYICPTPACPAVIGRIPVYHDHSHMTRTFVATLAPYLWPYLRKALASR